MNLYIDLDSSFRNRQEYPNPADFVIISKQDTVSADFECIRNSTSQQIVMYPPFGIDPILFYLDLDSNTVEKQYLPYMYKTNDPRVIQLDELAICHTTPTDIGDIVQSDVYSRGSIPLGQANQFYTGDYLENFLTKETRKIISFTYETTTEFVFQSSQVLWASLVGDNFKIGVSPISSTRIPPSNIYNYYRGKYLKITSGRARGFKSLITDYRIVNSELSVFTLSSFSGVLPQQGDIFQIVSDRRWYATIESPFTDPLPAYPAYQQTLPQTDIQFSLNTIYTTSQTLISLDLTSDRDISFVVGNSNIVWIDTIDPQTNLFWGSPTLFESSIQNKNSIYTGNTVYYISFVDLASSKWSISKLDSIQFITTNNIVSPESFEYTPDDIYEGVLSYLEIGMNRYIATVYRQDSNYKILFFHENSGNRLHYQSNNVGVSIIIHSLEEYNGVPFMIWSEFSNSKGICYYFSTATQVDGTGLFTSKRLIKEVVPNPILGKFIHYIRSLGTIVWNNQIITTIITYDISLDKFVYDMFMSTTGGNLWFMATNLLTIDSTLLDSSEYRGTQYIFYDTKFYFFFWDPNYGLSYIYTLYPQYLSNPFFDDKFFSPTITIQPNASIRDSKIDTNSNGFFIALILNDHQIITLNSESFVIAEAVQYRIRKTPPAYFDDIIPFSGESALTIHLDNPIEYSADELGNKYILYSDIYQQWIIAENNTLHYSSDLNTWTRFSNLIGKQFDWHYTIQVKELNALNSLVIENSYSGDLLNKNTLGLVAGGSFLLGISEDNTSIYKYQYLTAQRDGDQIETWVSTPLFPNSSLSALYFIASVDFSMDLNRFVVAGFELDYYLSMLYYTYNEISHEWEWKSTQLPTRSETGISPVAVVWSEDTENTKMFVSTGYVDRSEVRSIPVSNAVDIYYTYSNSFSPPVLINTIEANTYDINQLMGAMTVNEFFNVEILDPVFPSDPPVRITVFISLNLVYTYINETIGDGFKIYGYMTMDGGDTKEPLILNFTLSPSNDFADEFCRQLGYNTAFLFINTPYPNTSPIEYYYILPDTYPLFGRPENMGIAYKSTDGINWSVIPLEVDSRTNLSLRAGAWSGLRNIFCFVGTTYTYIYNPTTGFNQYYFVDNIDWETYDYFYNITWSPSLEIFCAVTNNRILTSPDGITWTIRYEGGVNLFFDITWSPRLRIFLTTSYRQILISFDGINWIEITYIFLLSTYEHFIWDDRLNAFCGISWLSGVSTLIFNSSQPRQYVCSYFNSETESYIVKSNTRNASLEWNSEPINTIEAGLGGILPKMLKMIFLDKINLFTAITSDRFWLSSEGNVWYYVELLTDTDLGITSIRDFVDYVWDTNTSTLYFISKTYNRLFYTNNVPQIITLNDFKPDYYSLPLIYENSIFSKIAYSDELGFVITTEKPSTSTIDFIRSTDAIQWSTGLSTNVAHTNISMIWNSFFRCFIGISDLGNPENMTRVLILSTDSYQWYIYTLSNEFYGMDLNQYKIGLTSDDTTIFADLSLFLSTNTLRTRRITQNGQVWIYNRETTYIPDTYNYINDIYNILNYQGDVLTLDRSIQISLPYSIYIEILGDTVDNFNGMNMPFHMNQSRCYSITLQDLVLPNRTLQTYIGNQISFYPYIYIMIQNEKTDRHSIYAMMTNHPKMTRATFKISVSQFSSDPGKLPFIRLFSPVSVRAHFNVEAPIRFSIYLPDGNLFQMVEQDTLPPDAPNPLLQVSATFRFNI